MDEQFLYDFRTGCGNSAKFARIFDMGFITQWKYEIYYGNFLGRGYKIDNEYNFLYQIRQANQCNETII